jgi:MFS family permease
MFLYPEIFVLLFFSGTIYAVMYGVTASLSVIFEEVYPYLNQTDIGLCFLAPGGGMLVGSVLSGRFMDAYYRKIRDDLIRQTGTDSEEHIVPRAIKKDPSFPIEKARLHILPWVVFAFTACIIGYGWALESKVTIAVPLILQFISMFFPRMTLHGFVSHHNSRSWRNSVYRNERHPDPASRHDAKPGIVYHGMCTSAFVYYPMDFIDSRIC